MKIHLSMPQYPCYVLLILVFISFCESLNQFSCPKPGGSASPRLPDVYSSSIRLNFLRQQKTVDVQYALNSDDNKQSLEFWADNRHVKYIQRDNVFLKIKYDSENAPTCSVYKIISNPFDYLESEDAGPNRIVEKLGDVIHSEQLKNFAITDVIIDNGVFVKKWESCLSDPRVNVSITFTETDWKQSRTSALHKGLYIVSAEAQIDDDHLIALFSNFDPKMPDDDQFQPPANVYCEGFRTATEFPFFGKYFSYDSEILTYQNSEGIAAITLHRSIYYDYVGRIVRTDFYDAEAENQDLFSKVDAHSLTVIQDYNAGIQYSIDPTGKCSIDELKATMGPALIFPSDNKKQPDSLQFFRLDNPKISFNGEFSMRGYMTDVYTARVMEEKKSKIYTWYFSTDDSQIVEKESVERDVLLRMDIRPEATDDDEAVFIINFYDFDNEEPPASLFDITSCFSGNFSKTFVLTFPANDALRGMENYLKQVIHVNLKEITKVSKQRIFVTEVIFTEKRMFADFKILDPPTTMISREPSLEIAINTLNESITNKNFHVDVSVEGKIIVLRPDSDGLNEYATSEDKIKEQFKKLDQEKDKERELEREREKEKEKEREEKIEKELKESSGSYAEGEVIGLTIGMLFLGFLLGAVTLNLIVSRKYGVALFFKKRPNRDPFSDSLRDSNI